MADNKILVLKDITKYYPGVVALDHVSLEFEKGEVHALCGENGAGKSTLIKAIAGALVPDAGTITIEGETFQHLTPIQAQQLGVEVIYQEFNLLETMTVKENIYFGRYGKGLVDYNVMEEEAKKTLNLMQIDLPINEQVKNLPSSQKQLVEIAKAISRNAKILIMDEPSAPLSVAETDKMFEVVRKLKAQGVTIIYISHRMDEIFEISDRVSVLRDGKYIATRNTKDTDVKELIQLMVGRELTGEYPQPETEPGEVVLSVKNLTGNGVRDISFDLRKGEILGFGGLVGAGRTELARCIFGADKISSGSIEIKGETVQIHSPNDAIKKGIGLIPEDRKQQGCFLFKTILWNTSIANLDRLKKGIIIDEKQEEKDAEGYEKLLNIKTPSLRQLVKNLSGGNQQKVVLAKTLATDSDIIIFDEPTRGIDVGAKQEIYTLMRTMANEGKAIIMITSDMPELLGMSDRILVLHEGELMGELQKEEFSQNRVLELASGLQG